MTTEPEQVLENNLIDQLVGLGRQSVTIKTAKDLVNNLKNQLDKHNKKTFTASEFDRILMHLLKETIFDKAKTLRDKYVLQKDNNEKERTFKKECIAANGCLKISVMKTKEELLKELEGIENTIWAYKIEFQDLEDKVRNATIAKFEKRKRILEARLKAIEVIKRLLEYNDCFSKMSVSENVNK